MSKIIIAEYDGLDIGFTEEAWFNATSIASKFDKAPTDWLRQADTVEYVAALAKREGNSGFLTEFKKIKGLESGSSAARTKLLALVKATGFIRVKAGAPQNGGGTWMHPKLGVVFARWLDMDFAIWCDEQIDKLLRGQSLDWKRCRHEAASSYKVMGEVLQMTRDAAGKTSAPYHYMNEARLVNQAITGEFKGLDREALSSLELDLLAKLEVKNAALIAIGHEYAERKVKLTAFVEAWKAAHPDMLLLRRAA